MKRIVESPLSYEITFIPVLSFGAGLVMLVIFGALWVNNLIVAHLHCERLEPQQTKCERSISLLGIRAFEKTQPIHGSLERASLESQTNSKGQRSYSMWLHTSDGTDVAFLHARTDFSEAQRVADAVNGFLQFSTDQTQLDVEEHVSLWFAGFLAVMLSVPFIMVFTSSLDTLEIEPAQRLFRLTRRQLWRTQRDEIPFAHLARIRVEERRGSKGSKNYRLWLHLSDGRAIDMGREESRGTLEDLQTRLERYLVKGSL